LRTLAINAGFLDPEATSQGGFLTHWDLKHPKEYIQKQEVEDYIRIFPLLSFFPDSRWDEIKKSLADDALYDKLQKEYKSLHWSKFQEGGKTRIARLDKKIKSEYQEPFGIKAWSKGCAKHDESSSFRFQVA